MQLFGSFKLLMALLGPSWPFLGPIWSQNGSQNGSKSGPESVQNLVQKLTPKISKNEPILGPKLGSKLGKDGESRVRAFLDGRAHCKAQMALSHVFGIGWIVAMHFHD